MIRETFRRHTNIHWLMDTERNARGCDVLCWRENEVFRARRIFAVVQWKDNLFLLVMPLSSNSYVLDSSTEMGKRIVVPLGSPTNDDVMVSNGPGKNIFNLLYTFIVRILSIEAGVLKYWELGM